MTKHMLKAYRTGLSKLDLYSLPERDTAKYNAERLERIWREEVAEAEKSGKPASVARAVVRFTRTRFVLACVLIMSSVILQFLGPVRRYFSRICVKILLENLYLQIDPLKWTEA